VGFLIVEDLGGDVVGGAAFGFFPFAGEGEFGGEAEVSDFDLQFFGEEEVT
jgi:hypothetical protein